jgi:hypothetical protein
MENRPDTTTGPPAASDELAEFNALQAVIAALQPLSEEARARIHQTAATFLKIGRSNVSGLHSEARYVAPSTGAATARSYSHDSSMSPKEFMVEKQPRSDVERIACLAYYLTHFRDTPHFKTLDLSKLNTEAAQPKFANAANSANNAVKQGYLAPSTKGNRQLSAAGEQFVRGLPDRDAAKSAMSLVKPKRRSSRGKNAAEGDDGSDGEE